MSNSITKSDALFDQKITYLLSKLQDKYLSMSELQKITYINDLVKKSANHPDTRRILINVRKYETKKPFGTNMLIDAAYTLFPTNATVP